MRLIVQAGLAVIIEAPAKKFSAGDAARIGVPAGADPRPIGPGPNENWTFVFGGRSKSVLTGRVGPPTIELAGLESAGIPTAGENAGP